MDSFVFFLAKKNLVRPKPTSAPPTKHNRRHYHQHPNQQQQHVHRQYVRRHVLCCAENGASCTTDVHVCSHPGDPCSFEKRSDRRAVAVIICEKVLIAKAYSGIPVDWRWRVARIQHDQHTTADTERNTAAYLTRWWVLPITAACSSRWRAVTEVSWWAAKEDRRCVPCVCHQRGGCSPAKGRVEQPSPVEIGSSVNRDQILVACLKPSTHACRWGGGGEEERGEEEEEDGFQSENQFTRMQGTAPPLARGRQGKEDGERTAEGHVGRTRSAAALASAKTVARRAAPPEHLESHAADRSTLQCTPSLVIRYAGHGICWAGSKGFVCASSDLFFRFFLLFLFFPRKGDMRSSRLEVCENKHILRHPNARSLVTTHNNGNKRQS